MVQFGFFRFLPILTLTLLFMGAAPLWAAGDNPDPRTVANPEISVEELSLMLVPLPRPQLLVEADAWRALLQEKAEEIARLEVAIARNKQLSELASQTSSTAGVQQQERKPDADKADKITLLEQVTALREQLTALVDRLRAVLDELERKTDEADADTLAKVRDLRLYSSAVGGVKIDVQDGMAAWIAAKGWLLSEEGGKRWAFNIARFIAILLAAWIVSRLLSSLLHQALARVPGTSRLLENFLVKSTRWVVMAIGLIMALAALEFSIGPLLAVVGAAGFVIAFALQDSLSNFASGLMILFFRPFDEGDVVDAGGVSGKVQSMNLVSTTIQTFDNKRMVVPNNKIWNDVITNATAVSERRIDMEFGIGYDDDIDKAHGILVDIITSHPKVLKEPEATVRMHTLADSSINFIARPWALTADYWDVYWDVTRAVKQRFDEANIGIPYPQRDVHLYIQDGGDRVAASLSSNKAASAQERGTAVREDGGLDDEDQG
ncbi:MAG: mechanosensitive ion channel domain-containing protein [Halieaceae bacterium]|nr:mechanosensitive ion channel domain-containing protein [Halieaceae bacterium]